MNWSDRPALESVVTTQLAAGSELRRCFHRRFAPAAFWAANDVRFGAAPRATLYTGDTDAAAVGETLLRDPQPRPGTNLIHLPYDHFRDRGLVTLRLRRPTTLISLRRPAVHAVLRDPARLEALRTLIETTRDYAPTRLFAGAVLDQVPGLEVLAWPSRRVDGHTVYCFYEGSVTSKDFEIVDQVFFDTPAGYTRLIDAVSACGLMLLHAHPASLAPDDDP